MRVEGEVAHSNFVGKVRDPASKRRNVGLEMLNLGVSWVIV